VDKKVLIVGTGNDILITCKERVTVHGFRVQRFRVTFLLLTFINPKP